MYFNGMFNIEQFNIEAEYAIFDDWFDWTKWTSYKQWLGAQQEFIVTDKYVKKKKIIWGKPTIVISNELPLFSDQNWIHSNCFIVQINKKIF